MAQGALSVKISLENGYFGFRKIIPNLNYDNDFLVRFFSNQYESMSEFSPMS